MSENYNVPRTLDELNELASQVEQHLGQAKKLLWLIREASTDPNQPPVSNYDGAWLRTGVTLGVLLMLEREAPVKFLPPLNEGKSGEQ